MERGGKGKPVASVRTVVMEAPARRMPYESVERKDFRCDCFCDGIGCETVFLADFRRGSVRDDLVGLPSVGKQGRTTVAGGMFCDDGRQTALFHMVLDRDDGFSEILL